MAAINPSQQRPNNQRFLQRQASHNRHLNQSVREKLSADVDLVGLESWRRRWAEFACLGGLADHPVDDQAALLRLAFDSSMQQVVEVGLGVLPTANLTPYQILDRITAYIRAKRNVALDRLAFRECRLSATENLMNSSYDSKIWRAPPSCALHALTSRWPPA